jgi:hypothetical protein
MKRLKYIILVVVTVFIIGCQSTSCALQAVAGGSSICYQEESK